MTEVTLDRTKPRLLIVDDQPANIHVMAEALRNNYELLFATSGAKALELAAARDVELVLLDVVLPDIDGFDICQRLKSDERTSRIPVIFVTAREEMSDETRGFEVGGVDYIAKPIRPPIVRARVRTHIELKRARDLLEQTASIDALTGIGNRRRFDTALANEWKRAVRSHLPFSLAILDVDFFKFYNDTYGHARGDECLRAVAHALAGVVHRAGDVVARYGGEELALILPDTDAHGAVALLRRVLDGVRDLRLEHKASKCSNHVSLSGGAVTAMAADDDGAARLVEAADKVLYEAKQSGRNRILHCDLQTGSKEAIL